MIESWFPVYSRSRIQAFYLLRERRVCTSVLFITYISDIITVIVTLCVVDIRVGDSVGSYSSILNYIFGM